MAIICDRRGIGRAPCAPTHAPPLRWGGRRPPSRRSYHNPLQWQKFTPDEDRARAVRPYPRAPLRRGGRRPPSAAPATIPSNGKNLRPAGNWAHTVRPYQRAVLRRGGRHPPSCRPRHDPFQWQISWPVHGTGAHRAPLPTRRPPSGRTASALLPPPP